MADRPVIGIFGAGKVGTALARLLIDGGYDVALTGSPRQTALDLLVSVVAPGARVTTPAELRRAMEEAVRSRKPTLINAVIDEGAGTESGRITSLNPSAKKK